jgi:hypothetical protein
MAPGSGAAEVVVAAAADPSLLDSSQSWLSSPKLLVVAVAVIVVVCGVVFRVVVVVVVAVVVAVIGPWAGSLVARSFGLAPVQFFFFFFLSCFSWLFGCSLVVCVAGGLARVGRASALARGSARLLNYGGVVRLLEYAHVP